MLKKFLLSSVIMTSSLAMISAVQAMDVPENVLKISVKKLQEGYEKKTVLVEGDEDSYYSVVSLTGSPQFSGIASDRAFSVVSSNNVFHILEMKEPGWGKKQNSQTGQEEVDYANYIPGYPILNLHVTRHPIPVFPFNVEKEFSLTQDQASQILPHPIIKAQLEKFLVKSCGRFSPYPLSGLEASYFLSSGEFVYTQTMQRMEYKKKRHPETGQPLVPTEYDYTKPKPPKVPPLETFRLTLTKINQTN